MSPKTRRPRSMAATSNGREDHNMEQVGVIGVGRMGLAMVKHLIKHGYQVTACDIDRNNLSKAVELGAVAVPTPAELAEQTTFVILGVGYDDEGRQAPLGQHALL